MILAGKASLLRIARRGSTGAVLLCLLVSAACTSFQEAVHTLEALQQEPLDPAAARELDPDHEGYLTYAFTLEGEAVENPEEEVLDALEEIVDEGWSGPEEGALAARVLCRTARRSPAAQVRAEAMRALRTLFEARARSYTPPLLTADQEAFTARVRRLAALEARGDASEVEAFLPPLAAYFSRVRPEKADALLPVLEKLGTLHPREGPVEAIRRSLLERLALETLFLTAVQGLRDRNRTVRDEAVDLLFSFPWGSVRTPLAENLEWNPYLLEPGVRNRVLKRLKGVADRPETVGLKVLQQIARGLEFADAAVVWRTVDLFRHWTGLKETDPDFWRDWWKDYLLKHAGDEG